jgi:hypothetical protein
VPTSLLNCSSRAGLSRCPFGSWTASLGPTIVRYCWARRANDRNDGCSSAAARMVEPRRPVRNLLQCPWRRPVQVRVAARSQKPRNDSWHALTAHQHPRRACMGSRPGRAFCSSLRSRHEFPSAFSCRPRSHLFDAPAVAFLRATVVARSTSAGTAPCVGMREASRDR